MSSHYFSVSTGSREKSTKFLALTIIKRKLVFKYTMLLEEGIEIKNIKMVKKSLFLNLDSVSLEKKNCSPEYKPLVSYFPDNLKMLILSKFSSIFYKKEKFYRSLLYNSGWHNLTSKICKSVFTS